MDHSEVKHLEQPATLAEWQATLLRAAGVIEDRGWCQGSYQSAGRVCAVGAVLVARGLASSSSERDDVVNDACYRMSRAVGGVIHHWNDERGRTKDEVVAKLRAVALGL